MESAAHHVFTDEHFLEGGRDDRRVQRRQVALAEVQTLLPRGLLPPFPATTVQLVHQALDRQLQLVAFLLELLLRVLQARTRAQQFLIHPLQLSIGLDQLGQQLLTSFQVLRKDQCLMHGLCIVGVAKIAKGGCLEIRKNDLKSSRQRHACVGRCTRGDAA